jgi:glucodextranase-like protein
MRGTDRPKGCMASTLLIVLLVAASEAPAARRPTPTPGSTPSATPTPVPPGTVSVVITDPPPDAVIDADHYNVRGTFQGPINTGVVVNDQIAYVANGAFAFKNLPLAPGANTITASATSRDGRTATTSVTVTATGKPPDMVLAADLTSGMAPLTVTFSYTHSSPFAIDKLAMDFDGDGRDDYRTNRPPASVQNTYTRAGVYRPTMTLTNVAGVSYTDDLVVEVGAPEAQDALFSSVWDGMNQALVNQDVSGALGFLNPQARENYASVFQDLLTDMPAIVGSYSRPQRLSIGAEILEYAVNRTLDGENRIFLIYLLRDADGVWRLDSM